jgi:hypothetical protein
MRAEVFLMRKRSSRILDVAKRGAEARFQDLLHEARLLLLAFPHLRDAFDKDELPISFIVARGSGCLTRRKSTGRGKQRLRAAD